MNTKFRTQVLVLVLLCISISCAKKPEIPDLIGGATSRFLYFASGACYSGNGITTFTTTTASNLIVKVNLSTGLREEILADYSAAPASAGDSPVGVVSKDENNLQVLIENAGGRRVEVIPKTNGTRSNFGLNPGPATLLNAVVRGMYKLSDDSLLFLKTGSIEKVNSQGTRPGSAAWVSTNLGATCGAANTLLTSVTESATGRLIATHAAASPANRIISVPASGATGSCSAAQAAPAATTYPVASTFDRVNGKLLVAFAGSTTANNLNVIMAYDFDESTGVISNPVEIYDAFDYPATYNFQLFGISSMRLDPTDNKLYVATAISTATTAVNYQIEKLDYDASKIGTAPTTTLKKTGSLPFYSYGIDTKCISSLYID